MWLLGAFEKEAHFLDQAKRHVQDEGNFVENVEKIFVVKSESQLFSRELKELYECLDSYPLQYRTIHRYFADDA